MSDFDKSRTYPYESAIDRLSNYTTYDLFLKGDHYSAFGIKGEVDFTERYNRLRYVVNNFCGLVSKVSADMTVGEGFEIEAGEAQEFIDNLVNINQLFVQVYEGALSASALGDMVIKVRIDDDEIVPELVNPSIYFPHTDKMSRKSEPDVHELAWIETHTVGEQELNFLIRELHGKGYVEQKVYSTTNDQSKTNYIIGEQLDIESYNQTYGTNYVERFETNIDESTIIYIPNIRLRGDKKYLGDSDYVGLESLQFALNNRVTVLDNILDKHQDPILALPNGIIGSDGSVRKDWLDVVELGENGEKPEYITWNANLESAFTEIDKILEMMFMTSETSPDALGIGKGAAESGRALKIRLIRTLAKAARKQMYIGLGLKKLFRVAQKLSIANNFTADGLAYSGQVEDVSISWSDGVVDDYAEMVDNEVKRINSGIQSVEGSLITLDKLTREQAEEKAREIKDSSKTVDFPADL